MMTSMEKRFWPKVDKRSEDECWPWLGYIDKGGYGQISLGRKKLGAHRVSWEIASGSELPHGMDACHTCDNPSCVNPAHIKPGSESDNMLDAVRKGRLRPPVPSRYNAEKTHCKRGHAFDGENTYVDKQGRRVCKTCRRASVSAWDARKRGSGLTATPEKRSALIKAALSEPACPSWSIPHPDGTISNVVLADFTNAEIEAYYFNTRVSAEPNTGCWIWMGGLIKDGYGILRRNGTTISAHRAMWEFRNGPMPRHLFACHSCDTPSCVNPDHVWPGTTGDNKDDARRKGRLTWKHKRPDSLRTAKATVAEAEAALANPDVPIKLAERLIWRAYRRMAPKRVKVIVAGLLAQRAGNVGVNGSTSEATSNTSTA